MDLYTASIALATSNANIPHPAHDWPDVSVYVPRRQRVKVKQALAFDRVEQIKPYRVFEEQLAAEPGRYVTKFDVSSGPKFAQAGCLGGAVAVQSMWTGYLRLPGGVRLSSFLEGCGVPLALQHTSGHASVKDLRRLADAVDPGSIVPIHSFGGHGFSEFFDRVTAKTDGEWWEV